MLPYTEGSHPGLAPVAKWLNAQVCKTCIRRFDPDPVLQCKEGRALRAAAF